MICIIWIESLRIISVTTQDCEGAASVRNLNTWSKVWKLCSVKNNSMPKPTHSIFHDDVITGKRFPRYWPFVRGNHWWAVDVFFVVRLSSGVRRLFTLSPRWNCRHIVSHSASMGWRLFDVTLMYADFLWDIMRNRFQASNPMTENYGHWNHTICYHCLRNQDVSWLRTDGIFHWPLVFIGSPTASW